MSPSRCFALLTLLPLTLFDRALIAGQALWFYAWKLVWPVNLMALYPQWKLGGLLPFLFPIAAAAVLDEGAVVGEALADICPIVAGLRPHQREAMLELGHRKT